MGNTFQIFSILVLSGETKRSQIATAQQVPDLVVERTLDVLDYL
jgi:ribonucleotide monophosphatase NagD (HAD superfamily)